VITSHVDGPKLERKEHTGMRNKKWWYTKGQTMAEYALIMAAVAIVVLVGYQTMGTAIKSVLSTVNTAL